MPYDVLPRPGGGPLDRLPRHVMRRVEQTQHRGVESVARINTKAYVTHVTLNLTAMLTAEEGRLIQQEPLGEPRYKALVDTYVGSCCFEIAEGY
jgi:hypothetical protein